MNIFTNKDIRNLFLLMSCILAGFIVLLQFLLRLFKGTPHLMVLLLTLLLSLCIIGVCFLYFRKQHRVIEDAITQINLYLSGKTDARVDCDQEGSLYKLFHAVNTLTTVLNAHAVKEQKGKEFLQDTLSDISHQLKTPLAALTIYNGLQLDETEDITAMREFATKSEKELDRIQMLVQNLLKITKLDAGSLIMEKSFEKMADIMNDVYLYFEFRAKAEQKTILLSGLNDALFLCDRAWIMEAISNIVKNALDHTETGGRITVEWRRLPAITQITISDNGSGIHPEDLHHIFKRFYRSRFSKDRQGIGLGLPLAKAIVEAHGGNIKVDSVLGGGSVFVINFLNLTKR